MEVGTEARGDIHNPERSRQRAKSCGDEPHCKLDVEETKETHSEPEYVALGVRQRREYRPVEGVTPTAEEESLRAAMHINGLSPVRERQMQSAAMGVRCPFVSFVSGGRMPFTHLKVIRVASPQVIVTPPTFKVTVEREHWWDKLKRRVLSTVLVGCFMGSVADEWSRDRVFKECVKHEMCSSVTTDSETTVVEAVVAEVREKCETHVEHVPKFVAEMTVALRVKLGLGAMDRSVPGNVVLVRSEIAKTMRSWNVRNKDAAAHLHLVEQCFFEDDTHYRVSNWRARACKRSRIVRWVLGSAEPVRFDF